MWEVMTGPRMSRRASPALGLVAFLTAVPAFAHHSFAMFDNRKTVTLEGTVKEFQWTQPHTWVELMVTDPSTGKAVEWSIEGGAVSMLYRQGWRSSSLKPGDHATVLMHPLKNGSHGGSLMSASVNGQKIGKQRVRGGGG